MRKECPVCCYPVQTCICRAVIPVSTKTEVIILQHPKETSHAKNTVKLLNLAIDTLSVYTGKTEQDFESLRNKLSTTILNTAVFYPSPDSQIISPFQEHKPKRIERAIFIDASWKQAYGIWQNNPWLNQYPFYQLPADYKGQYRIRQSKLTFSLSTLEAVAYSLAHIEGLNPTPLLQLLQTFINQWQLYIPHQR